MKNLIFFHSANGSGVTTPPSDPIQDLVDAYKTLVEADGGTIKNETDTYAAFESIYNSGEINTLWGYYVPAAGSKLTVNDYVEKAYSLVGTSSYNDRYGTYARPVLYDTVNKKWADSNVNATDSKGMIVGLSSYSGNLRIKIKSLIDTTSASIIILMYNSSNQITGRARILTTRKMEVLRYNAGISIAGPIFDNTLFSGLTEWDLFLDHTANEATLNGETKAMAGTWTDSVDYIEVALLDAANNNIEYIKVSKA